MINIQQLTNNLKSYITSQLNIMSNNTPIIGFMKPLIIRAIDKNIDKVTNTIKLISDNEGNIDIETILSEMMQNVINTQPFVYKAPFIGDIEIGNGNIKLNLPLTDKRIILNQQDLQLFKEALIKNG